MRRLLLKLRRRRQLHAEIETELALHRDLALAQGNPISLGNTTAIREEALDLWRFTVLEDLGRDLLYAARRLKRSPMFTITALLSLALGIGANTAIFSLVNTVLVRMLPVDKPGGLEQMTVFDATAERDAFSYPMFRALRQPNAVFSDVFARIATPASLVAADRGERGVIEIVSGNYFSALGVRPMLGRIFTDDDDRTPMSHPFTVLAFRYWKDRLSADGAIVGKTIRIDDYPFTVVGVAPPAFFGVEVGTLPDAWVPLAMQPAVLGSGRRSFDDPAWSYLALFGRRKAAITEVQAQAAMEVVFQRAIKATVLPQIRHRGAALRLKPAAHGSSRLRATFEEPLYVLAAVVGLVLLVACANLAGLLLARSEGRRREIAMRLSLGAGRARLVRQLLAESMLLGVLGGCLGVAASEWTVRALLKFLPAGRLPTAIDSHIDARVLAFGLALSLLTGLLFGLIPALQATRPDLAQTMKSSGRIEVRQALVIFQIALALLLLVGSGLFVESLRNAAAIRTGLDTGNVVTASVNPALSGYSQPQVANFYRQLEARLRDAPGIRVAGMSEAALLSGGANQVHVAIPGQPERDQSLLVNKIGGEFFEAAGIAILEGRSFRPADTLDNPPVAIVDETAARQLFGAAKAIGRKVNFGAQNNVEIVGVARDSKYRSVREETPPILYLSFAQERDPSRERTVYARTSGDPAHSIELVKAAIQGLDARLPVYNLKTFAQQKAESLARERFVATLSGFFAIVALLLAAIGLYGVMAQAVARRSREIGIRIALGADRGAVIWMVLRDALAMAAIGLAIGIMLSRWLGTTVSAQLYGVQPNDPAMLAAGCAIETAIAVLAACIPAWNASSVDPALTLRSE